MLKIFLEKRIESDNYHETFKKIEQVIVFCVFLSIFCIKRKISRSKISKEREKVEQDYRRFWQICGHKIEKLPKPILCRGCGADGEIF